jgi:hypothetical protein
MQAASASAVGLIPGRGEGRAQIDHVKLPAKLADTWNPAPPDTLSSMGPPREKRL